MNPRILIAGGGVAGLEAALALREHLGSRVDIDLLAPEERFVYRPLAVLEPFGLGEPWAYPLDGLLEPLRVTRRRDALVSVDPANHRVVTASGEEVAYDALLVALGSRPVPALPGATTFAGPDGIVGMRRVLRDLAEGDAQSVAFALPPGIAWPLPLYELALLTRAHLSKAGRNPAISIVTPEHGPLAVFGPETAEATSELLAERDITVRVGYPYRVAEGRLLLVPDGSVEADRVVAVPAHRGPALSGLPADPHGFITVDQHGAVAGVSGVWAAGDATDFPVKQGGLAAQQADAAAAAIAYAFGAPVQPVPFRPVLRGVILGADRPRHLRTDLAGGKGAAVPPRPQPLWWPPAKVAGLRLAAYLLRFGAPKRLPSVDPTPTAA